MCAHYLELSMVASKCDYFGEKLDDDQFFMALAFLTSDRSKDPVTQV